MYIYIYIHMYMSYIYAYTNTYMYMCLNIYIWHTGGLPFSLARSLSIMESIYPRSRDHYESTHSLLIGVVTPWFGTRKAGVWPLDLGPRKAGVTLFSVPTHIIFGLGYMDTHMCSVCGLDCVSIGVLCVIRLCDCVSLSIYTQPWPLPHSTHIHPWLCNRRHEREVWGGFD